MDHNQILPRIFVGSYPGTTQEIDRLKQDLGITAVLNLQTDEDADYLNLDWPQLQAHYSQLGIGLRQVPVRDFDAADLQKNLPDCVRALDQLLQAGHTVYAHCTLGIGRSPSVVVAYLHWVQGWDLHRAVDHLSSCRSCSPNVEVIRLAGPPDY